MTAILEIQNVVQVVKAFFQGDDDDAVAFLDDVLTCRGDEFFITDDACNEKVVLQVDAEILEWHVETAEVLFRFKFEDFRRLVDDVEETLDATAFLVADKTHKSYDLIRRRRLG